MIQRITIGGYPIEGGSIRDITPVEPRDQPYGNHPRYDQIFDQRQHIWWVSGWVDDKGVNHISDVSRHEPVWVMIKWTHMVCVMECRQPPVIEGPALFGQPHKIMVEFPWTHGVKDGHIYVYSKFQRSAG